MYLLSACEYIHTLQEWGQCGNASILQTSAWEKCSSPGACALRERAYECCVIRTFFAFKSVCRSRLADGYLTEATFCYT